MAGGVEYQVTKVDPTDPQTKGMVHQVHKVSEEIAATIGGKVYRARIINDPTAPTVAGKVYQIVLIDDPDDPSVKGMVYNAILTGGSEAVVVGPAVSPLSLPDAIADSLTYVKAFGGTEQNGTPTPTVPVDIISNNGALKTTRPSGLPAGYTALEYIETTGTQYIDTGVKLNQNNIVEVVYCYYTESDIATSGRMFGARYTSGSRNSFSIGSNSGKASIQTNVFAQFGDISTLALNNIVIGQWDTYRLSADGFYVSGTKQGDLPATTFETPFTVKLFAFEQASSSGGTPSIGCGIGRCKQFKVWNGDTLVMYLIPAKNSSNVVGMYDIVNDVFYDNDGTDDFIAGPNAVDPITIVTDGTVETIEDTIGNTATAEMLLKVGDYQDVQEILSGAVTRNVGVKVLDGTESWQLSSNRFRCQNLVPVSESNVMMCSHFAFTGNLTTDNTIYRATESAWTQIRYDTANNDVTVFKTFLADQYAAGTPVIVLYPLAESTTESVTGQTLQVQDGDNTLEITQASLSGLELKVEYEKEAE